VQWENNGTGYWIVNMRLVSPTPDNTIFPAYAFTTRFRQQTDAESYFELQRICWLRRLERNKLTLGYATSLLLCPIFSSWLGWYVAMNGLNDWNIYSKFEVCVMNDMEKLDDFLPQFVRMFFVLAFSQIILCVICIRLLMIFFVLNRVFLNSRMISLV